MVSTETDPTPTSPSSNSKASLSPLPLAASLQTTLNLLLQRLGHLLHVQAKLKSHQHQYHQHSSKQLPGYQDLVIAAQKWQNDVTALNQWIVQAQEALSIEYSRAEKREAEQEAKRLADEALRLAQEQQQQQQNGDTDNKTNKQDEDDDDDDKPLGGNPAGQSEQQSSHTENQQQQQDSHPTEPTSTTDFDFASLDIPGLDMSALMNMASQQPLQSSSSQPVSSDSRRDSTIQLTGTQTPFNEHFSSNFDMMNDLSGINFDHRTDEDGNGHDGGQGQDNNHNDNAIDFGAALEGVDWSSLLGSMGNDPNSASLDFQ
ncbi:unnamed protein product [Sympodiomycopsis kandeliae]